MLDKIVRELNVIDGVTMDNTKIFLLAYANDLALLRKNFERVKQHCRTLINIVVKCGLKKSNKKTKYVYGGKESL